MQVPTTAAEMDQLEPVVRGLGVGGAGPNKIIMGATNAFGQLVIPCRDVIEVQGRKLVLECFATAAKYTLCEAGIIVSSMPKRVPDFVLAGLESD
jgi:hypothetical protein